jgi:hypothetical protein
MQAKMLPAGQRQSIGAALIGVAFYGVIAVFFLVTGVGAWKHRRWVRPIMLSVSVPGLVVGLLSFAFMCVFFPTMMQMTQGFMAQGGAPGGPAAPAPPPGIMTGVMVFTLAFSFLAYVGIPGLFVALYWSSRLQKTCEQIDDVPRWTDGIPLPVLGTALWLGFVAVTSLAIPAYNVVPAFGALLTGWPVFLFALALCGICAALSYAVFRRHPAGWYGTTLLVALLGVSHVVTFSRIEMIELYRAMGTMPAKQLEILESMDLGALSSGALGIGAVALLALLAFLVWARPLFLGGGGSVPAPAADQP